MNARLLQEPTVLDPTDHALALTVPCPKTACAAFCGEPCRLYATRQPIDPHPQRVAAAKNASGYTGAAERAE